jgi:hypothetical protein
MKTEKTHKIQYIKPMQCKHSSITSRYIAYQLQIKGNNEVKKITQ